MWDFIKFVGKHLKANQVVHLTVVVLLFSAAVLTLTFHNFKAELWVPSMVCNLVTTAIAVYVVSAVVVRKESAERAASIAHLVARNAYPNCAINFILLSTLAEGREDWNQFFPTEKGRLREEYDRIAEFGARYRSVLDAQAIRWTDSIAKSSKAILETCDSSTGVTSRDVILDAVILVRATTEILAATDQAPGPTQVLLERLQRIDDRVWNRKRPPTS